MEQRVKERGIRHLTHFTKLENLGSILKSGIIPRQTLERRSMAFAFSDQSRVDGETTASCFSITFPNYKMFYNLRTRDLNQKWVVIGCSPSILWEKDCAFCCDNAASKTVTAIPVADRRGLLAFEKLFAPVVGKPSRNDLKLSDAVPTNPQAEVLVFGVVEPKYIVGIACDSTDLVTQLKVQHAGVAISHVPGFFSARQDYAHWKSAA